MGNRATIRKLVNTDYVNNKAAKADLPIDYRLSVLDVHEKPVCKFRIKLDVRYRLKPDIVDTTEARVQQCGKKTSTQGRDHSCQARALALPFESGKVSYDCDHPKGFLDRILETRIETVNPSEASKNPGKLNCALLFTSVESAVRTFWAYLVSLSVMRAVKACGKDDRKALPPKRSLKTRLPTYPLPLEPKQTYGALDTVSMKNTKLLAVCSSCDPAMAGISLSKGGSCGIELIMTQKAARLKELRHHTAHGITVPSLLPLPNAIEWSKSSAEKINKQSGLSHALLQWEAQEVKHSCDSFKSYQKYHKFYKSSAEQSAIETLCKHSESLTAKAEAQGSALPGCKVHRDLDVGRECQACCGDPSDLRCKLKPGKYGDLQAPDKFGSTKECVAQCSRKTLHAVLASSGTIFSAWLGEEWMKRLVKTTTDILDGTSQMMCPANFAGPLSDAQAKCCESGLSAGFPADPQALKAHFEHLYPNQKAEVARKIRELPQLCKGLSKRLTDFTSMCKPTEGLLGKAAKLAMNKDYEGLKALAKAEINRLSKDSACVHYLLEKVSSKAKEQLPCACSMFVGTAADQSMLSVLPQSRGITRMDPYSTDRSCTDSIMFGVFRVNPRCSRMPGPFRLQIDRLMYKTTNRKHQRSQKGKKVCSMWISLEHKMCMHNNRNNDKSTALVYKPFCKCRGGLQSRFVDSGVIPVPGAPAKADCEAWFVKLDTMLRVIYQALTTATFTNDMRAQGCMETKELA